MDNGATHYILSLLPHLPPSHIAKRCPYILETLNQSKKAMHCGAWLLLWILRHGIGGELLSFVMQVDNGIKELFYWIIPM